MWEMGLLMLCLLQMVMLLAASLSRFQGKDVTRFIQQLMKVLITGKEEPEAAFSPAMDAIIRIFKCVNGLAENDGDGQATAAVGAAFCAIRLLVASTQAISLIGKQGSLIKSIQESTGASVRVLNDEMPAYVGSDERIVELQGEGFKVLKALESVVGHLRIFLVDHSILSLFEKSLEASTHQGLDQQNLHSTYPVKFFAK